MTKSPRYPARTEPTPAVDNSQTGEIVTGIPISEDVPAGSPQYAAFEQHVERLSETNHLGATDHGKIEDRDNRGDNIVDGKYVDQLPIHEIDAMAQEMANGFANSVDRVTAQADGDTLTVTVVTKHGSAKGSAKVKAWTKAGVKSALDEIEDELNGNGKPVDNPDKTLADALRAAVKA